MIHPNAHDLFLFSTLARENHSSITTAVQSKTDTNDADIREILKEQERIRSMLLHLGQEREKLELYKLKGYKIQDEIN